jgi:hypothetical protein
LFKFVALTCALLFINYLFMFGCLHISQLENWRNLFFGVCSVGGFVNSNNFQARVHICISVVPMLIADFRISDLQ